MSSVQQNVIKHKVGLLNLAAELGNVSRACKVMGFSRDTFYRYQAAVEDGGIEALLMPIAGSPIPRTVSRKQGVCRRRFCVGTARLRTGARLQRATQARHLRFRLRRPFGLATAQPRIVQEAPVGTGKPCCPDRRNTDRGAGAGTRTEAGRRCRLR